MTFGRTAHSVERRRHRQEGRSRVALVEACASGLVAAGTDLGDERAVLAALVADEIPGHAIERYLPTIINRARELRTQR